MFSSSVPPLDVKEEDIQATIDLLLTLKQKNPGLRLTFGVSTFVPKAHTPFQWFGVRSESKKRLQKLGKRLRPHGIEVRPESYGWSVIQALISRSDRRLAPVIELVRGSQNTLGGWKKAYKAIQETNNSSSNSSQLPDWEEIVYKEWKNDRVLPWMHLNGPLKLEQLLKHQKLL